MRSLLFFFLVFTAVCCHAQTGSEARVDSLESILNKIQNLEKEQRNTETEIQKVDILCLLSREYDGIDSTKTFSLVQEALETSERTGYAKGFADANFTLGRALMYIDPVKALVYLEKGNEQFENLIEGDSSETLMGLWAICTYNLGLTYGYLGKNEKELEFTEKVIPVVEKLGDSLFLANIYTNLGVKHLNLSSFKDAYQSLLKGRTIYRLLKDPKETTFNLTQLAMACESLDSLGQMKVYLEESRKMLKKHPNDFDLFNYVIQNSQYFLRSKQPRAALKALDSIIGMVENDKSSVQYGMVVQRYARAYEALKDFENAINYTTEYITNSKKIDKGISWFQGLYKRSQYHASAGNYKNGYEDLLKAVDIYDSLETINTLAKLEELNLKYETAEKEKEILALEVNNEEKKSQAYLLGAIASILALLLFGGYYGYNQKLRKARKKERMQEAEVQLLKQEQQNKIYSAMIEGQEKERKRLAIDLHDGLGGRLSGISLNLSKLDKDEPKEYPKKQLQKVMKDLDDSLTELRTIARNMMPETLVKFGLQAALKDYCSSMTGKDTKVTLQFYGTDKGIDLNQQVTMYRVIQELINNAIKHAEATEVLVQYMREGNNVDITVEDNGVGFSKDATTDENRGMGLSNLRTRVAYLKGNLDFQSEENEGTTVNVHITIDSDAA
ncbi:tetratricopeptide repeat-containing sensor histidine kinase [Maribacter halichondriae]|uniref:tetratricopeptide repeat-containing sensor histidine kinase n=1 Tax=Maribacter halichondriae TaxID=2980554 RepID=UPI002358A5DA|nr:sensor histidine kinase [Maribacter sp. Hal144]